MVVGRRGRDAHRLPNPLAFTFPTLIFKSLNSHHGMPVALSPGGPGRCNPADVCCLIAHGRDRMWGSVTHVGCRNDRVQLQQGEGCSHHRHPMTPTPAQEGTGAWSFLPWREGRGGCRGHGIQRSPGVPNACGCNRQPRRRNTLFGEHTALRRGAAISGCRARAGFGLLQAHP